MNDCKKIRLYLHEYALDKTDEQLNTEIEKHLVECDECRRILKAEKLYCDNLADISGIMKTLPGEKDLCAAVTAQIEHEKQHPLTAASKRRFPVFSYGTAAAIVLVAALLFFAHKNGMTGDIAQNAADTDTGITPAENIVTYADDQESDEIYYYTAKTEDFASETEEAESEAAAPMLMSAPPEASLRASGGSGGAANAADGAPGSASITASDSVTIPSNSVIGGIGNTEAEPEYSQDTTTAAVTAKESPKEPLTQEADTGIVQTTEVDLSTDKQFSGHKLISDYNNVISSNALHLVYPQVILPAGDSNYYFTNFVASNSASSQTSLIEDANLYALNLALSDLTSQLDKTGVENYTVILPDDPASGDTVYLYFE